MCRMVQRWVRLPCHRSVPYYAVCYATKGATNIGKRKSRIHRTNKSESCREVRGTICCLPTFVPTVKYNGINNTPFHFKFSRYRETDGLPVRPEVPHTGREVWKVSANRLTRGLNTHFRQQTRWMHGGPHWHPEAESEYHRQTIPNCEKFNENSNC